MGLKCSYDLSTHKCVDATQLTGTALDDYNKKINTIIEERLKAEAKKMGSSQANEIRIKYEKDVRLIDTYGKFIVAAAYAHAAYYCSDICSGINITGTMQSTANTECYQKCARISALALQRMWEVLQ